MQRAVEEVVEDLVGHAVSIVGSALMMRERGVRAREMLAYMWIIPDRGAPWVDQKAACQ